MQAIRIRFGRDRNGNSTLTARCNAGSIRRQVTQGKSWEDNARAVANELIVKIGWDTGLNYGWYLGCSDPTGGGMEYVAVQAHPLTKVA